VEGLVADNALRRWRGDGASCNDAEPFQRSPPAGFVRLAKNLRARLERAPASTSMSRAWVPFKLVTGELAMNAAKESDAGSVSSRIIRRRRYGVEVG